MKWGGRIIKIAPFVVGHLAGYELSGPMLSDLVSRKEMILMFAVWLLANAGALYIWSLLIDDVCLAWRSHHADDEDHNSDE